MSSDEKKNKKKKEWTLVASAAAATATVQVITEYDLFQHQKNNKANSETKQNE